MKMKKTVLAATLAIALQGCATGYKAETGFFEGNIFGGGYSEAQLDTNIYKVSFKGNGKTSAIRAEELTLLRSAELTLEQGYNFFAVIDSNTMLSHSTHTTPASYQTTPSLGGGYTTQQSGGQTYMTTKPSTTNIILCFKERPPSGVVFNAAIVSKALKEKYDIKS